MTYQLHVGRCEVVLKSIPDNSVDSIVTDPPYGLLFQNHKWDYDVPSVEQWQECLRVLKPGGHLLAFGGSRTYHRLVVNAEDAGFEIRDQILWIYGSGFPKSHNLDGQWNGWGTALKPAHEPILMARKPFKSTVAENMVALGTGALNINACRIPTGEQLSGGAGCLLSHQRDGTEPAADYEPSAASTGQVLGMRQRVATVHHGDKGSAARFFYCAKVKPSERDEGLERFIAISASDMTGGRKEGSAGINDPRAGAGRTKGAKNNHPTVKPIALMKYLCKLITQPGGTVLDPWMGSGSTGRAAIEEGFNFVGIDLDPDYVTIASARLAFSFKKYAKERAEEL
ncbi:site-specific DNA-methyltransferase [Citrobacter cronae]|uniref:DNA-methyltransferase n=1 Tax=Citrobacter cronae TaxID=1748967 RepID=UPI00351D95D0